MPSKTEKQYGLVDASPAKSFFVEMLTRDISLSDSILDLLDNCVDGILRKKEKSTGKTPYAGFRAEITFSKNDFIIHDNCGGIPWSLHGYAFRMGRPPTRKAQLKGTVGTYGIGMKRAIFKIGRACEITTRNDSDHYEISITEKWMREEGEWQLPANPATKPLDEDGTTILIGSLNPGIADEFTSERFRSELVKMIESHYAFIIDKGFEISVNGEKIVGRPIKLVFTDVPVETKSIKPYIYRAKHDGVEVFLAVGFTRGFNERDEDSVDRYSSMDAGWTVVCNDRAVLYCDKTELTGWGDPPVPKYHTQFIAISGIVEFKSDEPSKLPTTTTKRGIDLSSRLYLQVRAKMKEGMLIFTRYTNSWKSDLETARSHIQAGTPLTFEEIKRQAAKSSSKSVKFNTLARDNGGKQFKPRLPGPKPADTDTVRMSFTRKKSEVAVVGDYLFDNSEADPTRVGERCFDLMLEEAKK